MIKRLKKLLSDSPKMQRDKQERERIAAREAAARDLALLRERGDMAVNFLSARNSRNHWGESVADMILGSKS